MPGSDFEGPGKPFPGIRMPGLYVADDGLIYMCGGSDEALHCIA